MYPSSVSVRRVGICIRLESPWTAGKRVAEDFNPTIRIPSIASLWGVRVEDINEGRSFDGRSVGFEGSDVTEATKAFRISVKSMITAARFDTSPGSWNSPVNLSIVSLIASLPSLANEFRISSYINPPLRGLTTTYRVHQQAYTGL